VEWFDPIDVSFQQSSFLLAAVALSPTTTQTNPFFPHLLIISAYKHLVDNAGTGSIFEGASITIGAASQTALSFIRLYYDSEEKRVYPFLTAIISVEDGIVTGITWDNACIFCSGIGDACQENTYNYNGVQQTQSSAGQETKGCFYTKDECDNSEPTETGGTICDVTVYVVWSGTDADGKALQSQAYRFSEFPAQELSDRITQLIPGRRELKNEEAASGFDL